jgi:hypothetical protein
MSAEAQLQFSSPRCFRPWRSAASLSQRVLLVVLGSLLSWEPPHGFLEQSPLRFL